MSRSYKKTPIIKDHNKGMKQIANRVVRRKANIPCGKAYKKFFQTYDVCDWSFYFTLEMYMAQREQLKHDYLILKDSFGTRYQKMTYRDWYKHYKGK